MLVIEPSIMAITNEASQFYKRFHNKLHNHLNPLFIKFILSRPTQYNSSIKKGNGPDFRRHFNLPNLLFILHLYKKKFLNSDHR